MTAKNVEIIEGEVTEAYPPTKNDDTGKWRPANIYIATTEGPVRLGQFPKGDYESGVTIEPIQMPKWYEALDLDNLVGARVQTAAVYQKTYDGTPQYGSVQTFKVLNGVPKAQTATQEGVQTAPAKMSRSELGAATGNAVSASTEFVTGYYEATKTLPDRETVIEAARLINIMSEEILTRRTGEIDPDKIIEEPFPEVSEDDSPDGAVEV